MSGLHVSRPPSLDLPFSAPEITMKPGEIDLRFRAFHL